MSTPPPDSTRDDGRQDTLSDPPTTTTSSSSSSSSPSPAPPPSDPTMAAPAPTAALQPPRLPSLNSPDTRPAAGMTPSSTPLGSVNAARRPVPQPTFSSRGGINAPPDIAERLRNFRLGRSGAPPMPRSQPASSNSITPVGPQTPGAPGTPGIPGAGAFVPASPVAAPPSMGVAGVPANFRLPNGIGKPHMAHAASAPSVPNVGGAKPSLAEKRGLKLPGGLPGSPSPALGTGPPAPGGRKKPGLTLSSMNAGPGGAPQQPAKQESALDKYSQFLDKQTGALKFEGKAILDSQGVKFAGGTSFSISLDEVDTLDELGKGNYGTVYKVRHSRPKVRRPGLGLAGNKAHPASTTSADVEQPSPTSAKPTDGTTGVVMAMKEMRLELDDAKFASIIMELDILHRCASPYIVEFYGAFFQEGAVYICMEYMDGGSVDKIYGDGVPEGVLRKITLGAVQGLRSLKDDHNIIHRDVKPTNILVNTRGQVKICDFGVSGNLVASIAKTNIGCQSYMAPERISSGGMAQAGAGGGTYSVQSDIWSLGLTIIECALGRYPYPPETYNNIFSQLSAIVDGDPPDLPDSFSLEAHDFVKGCLHKIPKLRPTYALLMGHPWIGELLKPSPIKEVDEEEATAAAAAASDDKPSGPSSTGADFGSEDCPGAVVDREVADWVKAALEKRRQGKLKKNEKPALHAAPLDVVASPEAEAAPQQKPAPGAVPVMVTDTKVDAVNVVEVPGDGAVAAIGEVPESKS